MTRVLHLAAIAAIFGAAVAAGLGLEYYRLPAAARPAHPYHSVLRSSGRAGLAYGVSGSFLFVLNLAYLLRKRLARWQWLGQLRTWMAFHVFTGLAGAALIVLHSAFLPRSALGIYGLLCLGIVVLAGLVGRYIHAHVPRSVEGRELESAELRRRLQGHRARLEAAGLDAALLDAGSDDALPEARGVLGRILGLFAGDRAIRREYRRLKRAVLGRPALRPLAPQILPDARRFCRDRQWLARYGELRGLMASWRFLHRWLAVVMIAVVLFHVALALRFGDLGLFS